MCGRGGGRGGGGGGRRARSAGDVGVGWCGGRFGASLGGGGALV